MQLPFARALIVDDEPYAQMRLQFALEQAGFQCEVAASGDEALMMLAISSVHVVVTEVVLGPHSNGAEFVERLCALEVAPVIVVHTRVLEQDFYRKLKSDGVDAILYKPADYSIMARTIRSLVEGRSAPQTVIDRWKKWQHGDTSSNRGRVMQLLRRGDGWIQESNVRVETFRFTIIVLACILFGMGWGNSLTPQFSGICRMFGLCGFAFYFCLELVAYQRDQQRAKLVRWSAERRLAEQQQASDRAQSACADVEFTAEPVAMASSH